MSSSAQPSGAARFMQSRHAPAALVSRAHHGSEAQASAFWERMAELVAEFDRLPRTGETMYGFAVGVYPTDQPTLPSGG